MNKVTRSTTDSFREMGSKFIGHLFPVDSKKEFENRLAEIKSRYPDATHHCYAWRIDPANLEEFAQDDGEPGGTAGLPILNQLKSYEAVNAAIVVVRYYGGTNLGKSGLIQAYGRSAEECLKKTKLVPITLVWQVEVSYPYSEENSIDQLMHRFNLTEASSTYAEKVTLILNCPEQNQKELEENLEQLEHRNIHFRMLNKSFV